jgi:hypothetical protein
MNWLANAAIVPPTLPGTWLATGGQRMRTLVNAARLRFGFF